MILLMLFGITGIFWMRSHRAKAPIQWSVGLFSTESIRRRADNFMRIADAAFEVVENSLVHTQVGNVTASDVDANQRLTYGIAPSSNFQVKRESCLNMFAVSRVSLAQQCDVLMAAKFRSIEKDTQTKQNQQFRQGSI